MPRESPKIVDRLVDQYTNRQTARHHADILHDDHNPAYGSHAGEDC
jgi:hypothetical protein